MKLFCYGTLRLGQNNHGFIKGAKYLGKGNTGTGYKLIIKGLPYLTEDPDGEGCQGELYEITNLMLKRIDQLEGNPLWYVRKELTIYVNGEEHKAWTYIMPKDRMGR